jgi:hypothetical protein
MIPYDPEMIPYDPVMLLGVYVSRLSLPRGIAPP